MILQRIIGKRIIMCFQKKVYWIISALLFSHFTYGQNIPQQSVSLPFATLKIDEAKNTSKKSNDSTHSKIFIGGAIGAGIPGFNYGATSLYKYNTNNTTDTAHTPGYAKTGFQFNLKGGYYFNENWGAMLQIGGNMNGFNSEAFQANTYLSQYNDVSVSGTSQYIGSYLAGVIFNMPPGVASTCKKISINFHLLAGLMTARYSTVTATYKDSLNISHSSVTTFKQASAFGFDFGSGVMYHFTNLVGMDFNLEALAGNPAFKGYTVTGNLPATVTYNIGMSTLIINFSVGIVLNLD